MLAGLGLGAGLAVGGVGAFVSIVTLQVEPIEYCTLMIFTVFKIYPVFKGPKAQCLPQIRRKNTLY